MTSQKIFANTKISKNEILHQILTPAKSKTSSKPTLNEKEAFGSVYTVVHNSILKKKRCFIHNVWGYFTTNIVMITAGIRVEPCYGNSKILEKRHMTKDDGAQPFFT